ncbi:MAG: hypothetical protein K6C40_04955 [Thermoguttaceae bacterium]|nr:hypothetical protein [Thermoguttaceae bacterium]
MKLFKLVPVAFRHFKDDDRGWNVAEILAYTDRYNPETQELESNLGGVQELEMYLNRGWSIVSIQTTPIPANDAVPGATITQYILSIEVPDQNVPPQK